MRSVALVGLALVACGGNTAMPGDLGNPVPSGRDPRCPPTAPETGATCDFGGYGPLSCEYGGDALGRGTTFADCGIPVGAATPQWFVGATTIAPNPAACPSTWSDAMASGACTTDPNLACEYDEGRCGCVCNNGAVSWACRARGDVLDVNANGSCPSPRPLAGDACATDQMTCLYDAVCGERPLSLGPALLCTHGYWEITVDTGAACGKLGCAGWTW
jgi:hypothetical protein